ncbi:DUF6151 family protein [Salinimonas chungwhensis]|uniref:DUF6151 family protein n=1 Tax=Salinimonas chungwhensis TaxID=265425 RepID=UPI00036E9A5B|nr:DUF6151 family protein [Salinimonas chungwhensis]
MDHPLSCECKGIQGHVRPGAVASRVLCYCKDCQAFARFLQVEDTVLNVQGGTHIVQLAASRVFFSQGKEHLAVVRLSEHGLLRWYASCCNTPIGNTLPTSQLPFIGLVDNILNQAAIPKDFPGKTAVVHTQSAIGQPKPEAHGLSGTMWRFLRIVAKARMSGAYKRSPFFTDEGKPVATPKVLTDEQRESLKQAPRSSR